MKRVLHIITFLLFLSMVVDAQPPRIQWAQTYGGGNDDVAYDIKQTFDGGFIVCGMTESKGAGGKDAYIIKLDPDGRVEWERTFGQSRDEVAKAIIQTTDSGYAFVGYTTSHGRRTRDVYFVKLDSKGNFQWEGIYGGRRHDYGADLVQTYDGNYAIVASTRSFGPGNYSVWVMKIDTTGRRMWRRTEGGRRADHGYSIAEHPKDSSLVVAGSTASFGMGLSDMWLLKIRKNGRREWRKHYGSENKDAGNHVLIKSTGEYIVSGTTQPRGERYDRFWVVGFTPESWDDWENTYGTGRDEGATGAVETEDKGVVVCGYTNSYGEGDYDVWLMKFDENGRQLWQETYGGPEEDVAHAIITTGPNEFVVAGSTRSYGEGRRDFWVIYLK